MKKLPPPIAIKRARALRSDPTDAERAMWFMLREHFADCRFRRQVPLRHFICDFVSHKHRLVLEIDGGQHGGAEDLRRTQLIEAEGYRVIRLWYNEVLQNREGCFARLAELLQRDHPHPASTRQQAAKSSHPSPIKGEG